MKVGGIGREPCLLFVGALDTPGVEGAEVMADPRLGGISGNVKPFRGPNGDVARIDGDGCVLTRNGIGAL